MSALRAARMGDHADENLAADLEAQIVSPLQIFRSIGKTQAELPKRINVHKAARCLHSLQGIAFYTCSRASPRVTSRSIFFLPRYTVIFIVSPAR
jgi:hypothetical protein